MAKTVTRVTGLGQPEVNPQDMYDWYTKLAGWRKRTPLSREEYGKVPIDAWMQVLGFKREPVAERAMEPGRLREQFPK